MRQAARRTSEFIYLRFAGTKEAVSFLKSWFGSTQGFLRLTACLSGHSHHYGMAATSAPFHSGLAAHIK
jgi:hypothetical protein